MNPDKNRHVLIIDDNRAIHDDFRKILSPADSIHSAIDVAETELFGSATHKEKPIPFEVDSAYQGQEGVMLVAKALEEGRPYALAFVDVRMPPGWDGVETTQKIWEIDPEIQIVICTAYSDYSWEEMFKKIGNDDRMVILKKPFDTVEALQLAHALTEKWWLSQQSKRKMEDLEEMVAERTRGMREANEALQIEVEEHIRAERMLRESEERFSGAFEYAPIGVALVSPEGRWLKVNRALCDMVGYSEADLLTRTFQDITHPDDLNTDLENASRMLRGEIQLYQMEKRYIHARGHHVTVMLNASLVRDSQGQPLYFISQIQDITERKKIEAQLFQSQKLETVGRLAGGIAHEFNSIMTAIIGQSELLLEELPPQSPLCKNATEIRHAADRAATLTGQLLAYGRKQILQPQALHLNKLLPQMEPMLRHLMGDQVEVSLVLGQDLKEVLADAGQIEQVIVNMAVNSRDAMPNKGKFMLETANVILDQESADRLSGLKPGPYVVMTITDTGMGMVPEVKARAFEPFFSSKGVGHGTGLGLATCYGILKQSGGHIIVDSEPGEGTTFKCYLPQAQKNIEAVPQQRTPDRLSRGRERVLLVQDDPALGNMTAQLLNRLGYIVLTAGNSGEALRLMEDPGGPALDLLFVDVATSPIDGERLFERILALHPKLKILSTSTYTEPTSALQSAGTPSVARLQKPYTPLALTDKFREILDGGDPSSH